jgi:hypothetical protein
MNKLQKLSQINHDIEILEAAGKIKAAEVLHKKFVKEAQVVAPNRTNYGPSSVNPQQQNYVQRNENSTTSVRDGVSTNFNFTGLQPEMIPVKIQTSPGNYTTVMRPKNNVGNPYQTRQNDPNANIPGYNEFLKLKPSATEIREFTESKGLTSPTGQAIFNAKQNGSSNPASPVVAPTATPAAQTPIQAVADNPNAGPIAPNPMTINTMPSARNVQLTSAPIPTAPVRTNKPQIGTNSPATNQAQATVQDNFPNFYTEQNDTSNFYQQQNSNPNAQQESIEQKLYMNALNNIENALKYNDRSTAETIYNKTINEFKNPKRKDLFGKQIQRVRSKYLNPAFNQGPKQY